jgi:hypothetical protein
MVKFGEIEIGLGEIDSAGKWLDRILNSRIGLALLIWGTFQFSLGSRLDDIRQDTGQIAANSKEVRQTSLGNHDMLVRLLEHCSLERATSKAMFSGQDFTLPLHARKPNKPARPLKTDKPERSSSDETISSHSP